MRRLSPSAHHLKLQAGSGVESLVLQGKSRPSRLPTPRLSARPTQPSRPPQPLPLLGYACPCSNCPADEAESFTEARTTAVPMRSQSWTASRSMLGSSFLICQLCWAAACACSCACATCAQLTDRHQPACRSTEGMLKPRRRRQAQPSPLLLRGPTSQRLQAPMCKVSRHWRMMLSAS